jgi:hypothetical protein
MMPKERNTSLQRRAPQQHAQDHGADVLGHRALEQVGAAAGAVTDVVAHQVSHDGRVAGVILGDALLHLAHQVGPDVGRLGEDPAAQLREQRHEAGAEAQPDDQERRHGRPVLFAAQHEAPHDLEHAPHAQQRQRHHQEAGHRAATQRDGQGIGNTRARRRRHPHVRAHGHPHADDARERREQCADEEGHPGVDAHLHGRDALGLRVLVEQADHGGEQHRRHHRQDQDGAILPTHEGHRADVDHIAHATHGVRAGVALHHVAHQPVGKPERDQDRHGHQVGQLLCQTGHSVYPPPRKRRQPSMEKRPANPGSGRSGRLSRKRGRL